MHLHRHGWADARHLIGVRKGVLGVEFYGFSMEILLVFLLVFSLILLVFPTISPDFGVFKARDVRWNDTPTFQDLPLGYSLYPAMSVKGKAAFCFGRWAS